MRSNPPWIDLSFRFLPASTWAQSNSSINGKNGRVDTLTFSLTAKLGFLQTPIRGTALVTDSEVILDVDLGLLGKLIPEQVAKTQIVDRTKGLLKN
jgi:hypothetical protein